MDCGPGAGAGRRAAAFRSGRQLQGGGPGHLEPHRGHRVVPLSRADIEDIFWLQGTIARELAATVARRITAGQIDELVELNTQLAAAAATGDPDQVAQCEFAFHRAFNRDNKYK